MLLILGHNFVTKSMQKLFLENIKLSGLVKDDQLF